MPKNKLNKKPRTLRVALFSEDASFNPSISPLLISKGCEIFPIDNSLSPSTLRAVNFDLCIIDLAEPGITGQLLLRRIPAEIPVIAIINDPLREFEFAGIFDVLTRPIDFQRLSEGIEHLLSAARPGDLPAPPPTEAELEQFSEFILNHCGLHFDRRNRKILERGIQTRMRIVASPSVSSYFSFLTRDQESRREEKKLVALLTIGETSFFRFDPHFAALTETVIPELIKSNRLSKSLRIWSAGCSTGEEVYSLAITLLHHFPQLADWEITILGTDISPQSLETARQGIYQKRTLRHVSDSILNKWFNKSAAGWAISDQLRQLTNFSYLNLQSETYPSPKDGTTGCDLIFCRNVMIYFRPETVRAVVSRLRRALRPGGYLFLGHAETLGSGFLDFVRCQHQGGIYYRAGDDLIERTGAKKENEPVFKPQFILFENANSNKYLCTKTHKNSEENCGIISGNTVNNRTSSHKTAAPQLNSAEANQAVLDRGFSLADQGKFDEAFACCQQVLHEDDLSARGYFLRGLIYHQKGELIAAAEDFQRVILLDIKDVLAHYHLAHIYRSCGRKNDALRSLNTTVRLLARSAEGSIPDAKEWTVRGLLERCHAELKQMEK